MRTQEEIQQDMVLTIADLAKYKDVTDPEEGFEKVLTKYPDIKSKWDNLIKEAEELRSKGQWKFGK